MDKIKDIKNSVWLLFLALFKLNLYNCMTPEFLDTNMFSASAVKWNLMLAKWNHTTNYNMIYNI